MILTLIGMSGVGKTFWATRLAAQGFTCFHCDALLADKLHTIIDPVGSSLPEIGAWMGLPYQADFRQREAKYLACEAAVLQDVIARASDAGQHTDCVIDTGGSAIYADTHILQQLQQLTTVIYLTVPATRHQQMLMTYLAQPLPLIWNGLFNQAPDESIEQAFIRCYSLLITHREQLYERYSDVRLAYSCHRDPELTTDRFLRSIQLAGGFDR